MILPLFRQKGDGMNKETILRIIDEKSGELAEAIGGDDIEAIRQKALEVHALVHPAEVSGAPERTIADYVFDYMTDRRQNVPVPRQDGDVDLKYAGTNTVPLCWHFWHTSRIEDLVSNILMANGKQIFDAEWQREIGASITDTGNALEEDEAAEFGAKLNIEALRRYMIAVGKNTRKIIEGLTLDQVKAKVPEEWVMRILEEGGVTTDFRSVWLLVFWGRLTVGGMLLIPITDHHMMHLSPCVNNLPIFAE